MEQYLSQLYVRFSGGRSAVAQQLHAVDAQHVLVNASLGGGGDENGLPVTAAGTFLQFRRSRGHHSHFSAPGSPPQGGRGVEPPDAWRENQTRLLAG